MSKRMIRSAGLAALALGTALAAQAQSSVTLYGRVVAGVDYQSNVYDPATGGSGNLWRAVGNQWGTSMLGFKGEEDLGGGLHALFTLESGFSIDDASFNGAGFFNRRSFVGLRSGWGTLKLGKDLSISDAHWALDPTGQQFIGSATLVRGRNWGGHDNMISYETPSWGELWLVFGGEPRFDTREIHPHESGIVMWLPMAVLSFMSFFFVFSLNPFDASGGWFLGHFDVVSPGHSVLIPILSAMISLGAIALAISRARSVRGFLPRETVAKSPGNVFMRDYSEKTRYTTFFLSPFQLIAVILDFTDRFLVDALVNAAGILLVKISEITGWADRVLVDGVVRLVTKTAKTTGSFVRTLQNGKIQSYYLVTFISLIVLVIWLLAGK